MRSPAGALGTPTSRRYRATAGLFRVEAVIVYEALMRFGDLNREAGDEVEDIEVDASFIMGAAGIDSDRGLITVISDARNHDGSPKTGVYRAVSDPESLVLTDTAP
jgi:hypothetical protein